MKRNVVVGLRGTPAAFNTPPPVPLVDVSQSPTFATGALAITSPSMLKPPDGTISGATPAGGGEAWPDRPQSRSTIGSRRLVQGLRPFIPSLVETSTTFISP